MAGVVYIIIPAISFLWLRDGDYGYVGVIWLLITVWSADSIAFFCGKLIGGVKLSKISPNKTWSGLFGALIGGTVCGVLVFEYFLTNVTMLQVSFSFVVALLSQCGDLFESAIKRRFNVKDTGSIIPGHGGILDRLDSIVFSSVFVFFNRLLWLVVKMKSISIFGSTGSIGVSCLDVIRNIPKHEYKVLSLVANSNYKLLAAQAIEFGVKLVVIRDEKYYKPLKELLSGKGIYVRCGDSGILEACSLKSDLVVGAIVGIAGLMPTYNAIIQGSDVLLANKESLVCGGDLIKKAVKKHNVRIVPVDSEHNAIFQVFDAAQKDSIHKITLTASGGPFRGKSKEEISKVSVKEALNHPTWKMGKKSYNRLSNNV